MSEQEIRAMDLLDIAAEKAGGYVASSLGRDIHYDYRKILDYCKKQGKEPLDMTIREMNQFIIAK